MMIMMHYVYTVNDDNLLCWTYAHGNMHNHYYFMVFSNRTKCFNFLINAFITYPYTLAKKLSLITFIYVVFGGSL